MIGIQVITHGKFAEGIIDSVDMIIGNTEQVAHNELKRGQDIDEFREEVKETTEQIMSEDGVLIFVDMFGASPYNSALINSRDIEGDNYKVITGVNLPLLIEAISNRASMDLDKLYKHILDSAEHAVMGWEKE
ncbi:PTS mannose transporter subunit IIAB [Suicoccus acidiformans]|uniref:PTS mannose transporter subunit IIAB n=1 Tax=Suicoccus acidiformans TaxID=2036206 RepID=A0A347WII2_9LACT|nr:PTS sugar transporter subunit IIA [Suicoccus acidiformans]AXY24889.1 PTS mannose transporter subunit IIAB [Suicoccus acidiformans]